LLTLTKIFGCTPRAEIERSDLREEDSFRAFRSE
jgi:hypothetical protein